MHDPELRDNPPATHDRKRTRPFDFQQHLYNQSHPDIVKFLERLRELTDSYGGRFTLAEVGGDHALAEMKEFTGGDRLDSAYGFDFLYAEKLTPRLVASVSQDWPETAGWPSWAFENHDAPRAISRWSSEQDRDRFARLKTLLLATLRGSIILYQGEELGLPQVDVPFHRLQDPEAIANWPQTLSRDGARTPMPWQSGAPQLGFSEVEPWLPVGESHGALAVDLQHSREDSLLRFTAEALKLRNAHPALRGGSMEVIQADDQLLVFERSCHGERLRCTFNLSIEPVQFTPAGDSLFRAGDLDAGHLGPYSAVIEEIA
jgi:alpha-glucosidase